MALRSLSGGSFLKQNKEWLITWSASIVVVMLAIYFWPEPPSPVPTRIRQQTDFSIIYPSGYTIEPTSWEYLAEEKAVQFTAKKGSVSTVFTEEETPLAYRDDQAAYARFIGGLRPRINFEVPLGTVSISNFVTQVKYDLVGETGILNAKGTLLLAHPDTQPTDDQWRDLFESLQID